MISIKRFESETDEQINEFVTQHSLIANGLQVHPTLGTIYALYDDAEPFGEQNRQSRLKTMLAQFKDQLLQKEVELNFYTKMFQKKDSEENNAAMSKAHKEKDTLEEQIAIVQNMLNN